MQAFVRKYETAYFLPNIISLIDLAGSMHLVKTQKTREIWDPDPVRVK